jgi:hypothetical protein
MKTLSFLCSAVAAVTCIPANAATLFVSVNGLDSPTCGTSASPCLTIQYAVDNRAANGDTVAISAGVFTEEVSISIPLTVSGAGEAKTFIDGNNKGIVFTINSTVTVEHLTLQHGRTINCGAGLVNNATATLRHVTVTNNSAPNSDVGEGLAGGVCNNGTMSIEQSTISSNNAEEAGGIYNLGSQLVIHQSTISFNSTGSFGGGIESFGPMAMINSTIYGNSSIYGGGIDNHNVLTIYNCTMTNNSALTAGGIFSDPVVNGPIYIWNSILSGNSGSYASPDCIGTLTSEDYNQIGTTSGCAITLAPHDTVGAALLLGPLQSNGGPTFTLKPGAGSPAINGGNPAGCAGPDATILTVDQRGAPRDVPPCDAGSVEVHGN